MQTVRLTAGAVFGALLRARLAFAFGLASFVSAFLLSSFLAAAFFELAAEAFLAAATFLGDVLFFALVVVVDFCCGKQSVVAVTTSAGCKLPL